MDKTEREAYDRHVDAIMIQNDVLGTAKFEGLMEGRMEGREEGREEGRMEGRIEGEKKKQLEIARTMKTDGISTDVIAKYTGVSPTEIEAL